MCCACPVTSTPDNPFNAVPPNWATDRQLLAGLWVDDDDEHDDPVLKYADDRTVDSWRENYPYEQRLDRGEYDEQKYLLQVELLKFQNWTFEVHKHVIVFEGRDAAGKGGTIKRFMEHLNPAAPRSWRSPSRAIASRTSGTSSVTCNTCRPAVRSPCSTGPGTTARSSNT